MNYGKIYYCDTANGIGCRTVLFVSGCRHHCKGCFNPETWNFNYGQPYTDAVQTRILESLQTPYIDGLTILGGEPFEPENQPVIHYLVSAVRTRYPDKSIWIYSGYTWEELIDPLSFVHTEHTLDILPGSTSWWTANTRKNIATSHSPFAAAATSESWTFRNLYCVPISRSYPGPSRQSNRTTASFDPSQAVQIGRNLPQKYPGRPSDRLG